MVDGSKTQIDSTIKDLNSEALTMIGSTVEKMKSVEDSVAESIQQRSVEIGNRNQSCILWAQEQLNNASRAAGDAVSMRTQIWYDVTKYFYKDDISSFMEELELFMVMMPLVTWYRFPYNNPVTEFEIITDTLTRGATAVESDFEIVVDIMLMRFLHFEVVVMELNNNVLLNALNEATLEFQNVGEEIEMSLVDCV